MNLSKEYKDFIDEINLSTSSNNKVTILKKSNSFIKEILFYTYNPYYNFGITSKNLIKRKDLKTFTNNTIFQILDLLRTRKLTGHNAISIANGFIEKNPELTELFYSIIDKDLKIRCGIKLINKAIPNLIPEFSVALAESFNEKSSSKMSFDTDWFVSRKLDGVRCLTIIDENGNISFYSRAGKEFNTLGNIENEIKSLNLKSVVFDGEICKFNNNEKDEDFQGIIKEIRRKNHVIKNATYYIFDYLNLTSFNLRKSVVDLNCRINNAKKLFEKKDFKHLKLLEHTQVYSLNELNNFIQEFKKDENKINWEGLIVRKNTKYNGKRSRDILKVKTFHDAEYIVKSVIFGNFRHVVNNHEVETEMLSAVVIEHKGNSVNVGSGFSIEQRQYYHEYPEDIIGKTITVQYFEESKNQLGEYSLRFPVVKAVYDKERNF